jgi:hypothetical protein
LIAWTSTPHTFKNRMQLLNEGWVLQEVWEMKQAIYEAQDS